LYKAFPPAKAQRLLDRLEIHYTPKIELSLFARQYLNQSIQDLETLHHEAIAWAQCRIDWR